MHSIVVALILSTSACGGADGPVDIHAVVACDQVWIANGFTQCEEACVNATTALNAMGTGCQAHTSSGAVACSKTFEFQGVMGCCATNPPQVMFGECN